MDATDTEHPKRRPVGRRFCELVGMSEPRQGVSVYDLDRTSHIQIGVERFTAELGAFLSKRRGRRSLCQI